MARPKNTVPTYRHHKATNTARCWVNGRWVTLGRYDSPESREAYARLVAEHAAGVTPPPAGASVNEVLLAYLRFADGYYRRPDGTPTNEVPELKATLRPVRELYGHSPAAEFGPLALKAVRQRMIELGWCRKQVNRRVGRVKRVFKWAASEQLVPAAVYHGLQTVAGLQPGRTSARESAPVLPVDERVVEATLPHLNRHAAGLVRFQRLTGCRPGEACQLRRCDVDASAPVWVFRPAAHKMSYRGRPRVVHLGPQAQALLAEFPTAADTEFVFSPRRERAERSAARAGGRATKYYASRQGWQKAKPPGKKRLPGLAYTSASYGAAVRRACRDAGVEAWHPNQLRHLRATEVRKAFGLEHAQVVLGHAKADVTEIYAEKNDALAAAVAKQIG